MDLFKELPNFKQSYIYILIASFFINILGLIVPITLMQIYDRIIPNEATSTLTWLISACGVALFFEAILRISRQFMSAWMSAQFDYTIGSKTVDKMLNSDMRDYEKSGFGVHLERVNAVGTMRGYYSGQVFQILMDMPFIVCFILVVMYLSFHLAFIPIAMILLYLLTIALIKGRFEQARAIQMDHNDRRFGFVIQVLSGIHSLIASALEEQILRRYESLQSADTKNRMLVNFWTMLPNNLAPLFTVSNIFLVVCVGSIAVINDEITIGTLTACTILSGRAMQPVQQLANFMLRHSDIKLANQKLDEVEAMEYEVAPGTVEFPKDVKGTLELRDVSFQYDNKLAPVLTKVNLDIQENNMVAISASGSSGATTLLYILLGILKPSNGIVLVGDNNLSQWDHTSRHTRMEYLPKTGELFKGTIMDNITMFDNTKYMAASDVAKLVDLDELVSQLPQGYETQVDSRSGGMLPSNMIQRISIARALIERPRILLLDKTNDAMDPETEKMFFWLLSMLKGKCTIVVVTSDDSLLKMSDARYQLSNGELVEVD